MCSIKILSTPHYEDIKLSGLVMLGGGGYVCRNKYIVKRWNNVTTKYHLEQLAVAWRGRMT